MESLKKEGGLGASKELRAKYSDHPAFQIEEDPTQAKRPKLSEATAEGASKVFTLPVDKPKLADLRIEPKEYFRFVRS